MAVLSNSDRAAICAEYQRNVSDAREQFGALTKVQLRAAFDGIDDFLNTNASAINTAIPTPARTVLTAPQKARLLVAVVQKRYLTGA